MYNWTTFVFGILIGWLLEWVIDWFYWRRKYNALNLEISQLQTRVAAYREEKSELEVDLRAMQTQVEHLKTRLSATPNNGHDNLQDIKGIGPVIDNMLKEADISSFKALSNLSSQRLREILGDNIKRLANEDDILNQARLLVEAKQTGQA